MEVLVNLVCYDGVKYGFCVSELENFLNMYVKICFEGFGLEVKCWIMIGIYVLLVGYYDVYYLKV